MWLDSIRKLLGLQPRSKRVRRNRPGTRRRKARPQVEILENRITPSVVWTDRPDYAPGDTAIITATGFLSGETVNLQVLHTDGTPNTGDGHEPWQVTDGFWTLDGATEFAFFTNAAGTVQMPDTDRIQDGNIGTSWYVNPDDSLNSAFELTAQGLTSGLTASTTFTDAIDSDFHQAANNDGEPGGLGDINWINSILQSNNSVYFEGSSIMQRLLLTSFVDAGGDQIVTLEITTQATKGGIHGYDWLTSWDQAITAAANLGTPFDNVQVDPNQNTLHAGIENNLTLAEASDDNITPSFAVISTELRSSSGIDDPVFYVDVEVPDDPFVSADGSTQTRINAYEAAFGNRTIRIYSNQAISSNSLETFLTLSHSVANGADTGDSDINYVLTIKFVGAVTTNTQLMIELAGHVAKSNGTDGWGAGNGASNISGGPYHFSLGDLDGASLGSQDNQLKGADIQPEPAPSLNIVKDAVAGQIADVAGELLTYSITVENTGNTTLTGVTVTDPYADAGSIVRGADAPGDNDALLEVGETWTFTAAHTVTQAEIDSNGGGDGFLENTATADSDQTGPDTDDAVVPVAQTPGINVVKFVNGQDANSPTGPLVVTDSTLTFTYVVTNTGNVTLSNVTVNDNVLGAITSFTGDTNLNDKLDLNETWTFTKTATAVEGQQTNIGTASGQVASSEQTVTDTDPANYLGFTPAIGIAKFGPPTPVTGTTITYRYEVRNLSSAGSPALTRIVLNDDNGTPLNFADDVSSVGLNHKIKAVTTLFHNLSYNVGDTNHDRKLDIGEVWKYKFTRPIRTTDVGTLINTVQVFASPVGFSTVNDPLFIQVTDTATLAIGFQSPFSKRRFIF